MHIQTLLKEIHAETFRFILFTVYDTMYLQALNKKKRNRFLFNQCKLIFILIYILCVFSLLQVYMYVVLDITCI